MEHLIRRLEKVICDELRSERSVATLPVYADLKHQLDLSLPDHGTDAAVLDDMLATYLALNPDVSRPDFCKQLYSGRNDEALLGDWVSAFANTTMHSFKVGPVATLMETAIIDRINELLGFHHGDGVMVSGGSQANLVAMLLARHHRLPNAKTEGVGAHRLTAFVSDQSHYSMQRAANTLGIGTNQLISVASDEHGCMDPRALREAVEHSIERGETPFMVGLTAGTTVVGAFDPIPECAEIARDFNLWLHMDAAWGGPVRFAESHRHLIKGVELLDSFSWDAHKLLNVTLTAAAIQVRQKGMLRAAISGGGDDYLFHDDEHASMNLGELSLQCGRRADALKVWLSWRAVGTDGFANKVERLQTIKSALVDMIKADPDFKLIGPSDYLNVLFQYIPPSNLTEAELRELHRAICKTLVATGGPFIEYARFKAKTGIRMIIANVHADEAFMRNLLAQIRLTGQALAAEWGLRSPR